jgi:sulfur carrier protein ThiS
MSDILKVTIRPHGELVTYFGRRGELSADLPSGSTVREMLAQFNVPENEVWMVARNGTIAKATDPVADGDQIEVFSPVAGG